LQHRNRNGPRGGSTSKVQHEQDHQEALKKKKKKGDAPTCVTLFWEVLGISRVFFYTVCGVSELLMPL
jgi:hypothetical protein